MWDEVAECLTKEDIYVDTSFVLAPHYRRSGEEVRMLEKEKFVSLVRKYGTDKVLFGTDSPWADQSVYVERIKSCGLSEDELEKITEKNALRFLGI